MKKEDISTPELIMLSSLVISLTSPAEFLKDFPDLAKWTDTNVDQKALDTVRNNIKKMVKNQDKQISVPKEDLTALYSHTMAVIGFKEAAHRYPKVRSLLLNVLDQEQFNSLLGKVTAIEESLKEKYSL